MRSLIGLVLVAAVMPVAGAFGDMVTYTVDPARSSLTISGTWGSLPIQPDIAATPPDPNGLAASFVGTITANRNLPGSLQIETASIAAQNGGALFAPFMSPANYGFNTGQNEFGAIRGFSFALSSPVITSATFDAAILTAVVSSGQLDFAILTAKSPSLPSPPVFDETDGYVAMLASLPLESGNATLGDAGGIETLTIPIETSLTLQVGGEPLVVHFSGTIVASDAVPEPATLSLFALVLVQSLIRRRQRH